MNINFFTTTEIQEHIKNKLFELDNWDNTEISNFSKERNSLLARALRLFLDHASMWDEKTQYNIENIQGVFIKQLTSSASEENLNKLFVHVLRFFMESYVFNVSDAYHLSTEIKNFAMQREHEFDNENIYYINFALKEMPLNMLRKLLSDDNAKSYKEYIKRINDLNKASETWEETMRLNIEKSETLNDSLILQGNKFNFVGLSKGFFDLSEKKKGELKWAQVFMFVIAVIIPTPLIFEIIKMQSRNTTLNNWQDMLIIIPIISLTLILIYFFRVALQNVNSIRAQLVQIDLRLSLCQFIQNYTEYSKVIQEKNPKLLAKFEEIIFSNIMANEDKIPSTFDGVEQLATLISAFKKTA